MSHTPTEHRIRFEYDPDPDHSYLDQEEFAGTGPVVSYGAVHEVLCPCCETWSEVDAVWGCDILESEDRGYAGTYRPTEVPAALEWTLTHFDLPDYVR